MDIFEKVDLIKDSRIEINDLELDDNKAKKYFSELQADMQISDLYKLRNETSFTKLGFDTAYIKKATVSYERNLAVYELNKMKAGTTTFNKKTANELQRKIDMADAIINNPRRANKSRAKTAYNEAQKKPDTIEEVSKINNNQYKYASGKQMPELNSENFKNTIKKKMERFDAKLNEALETKVTALQDNLDQLKAAKTAKEKLETEISKLNKNKEANKTELDTKKAELVQLEKKAKGSRSKGKTFDDKYKDLSTKVAVDGDKNKVHCYK